MYIKGVNICPKLGNKFFSNIPIVKMLISSESSVKYFERKFAADTKLLIVKKLIKTHVHGCRSDFRYLYNSLNPNLSCTTTLSIKNHIQDTLQQNVMFVPLGTIMYHGALEIQHVLSYSTSKRTFNDT